ncbi:Protein SDA1-like protein [Dichanthelium oligosanthes]|uniref:Protein SDA1 n=1 Tax=Dichanthelium oligosanthes TaxID=888268 RepID=A0A1E5UY67_9POAL|nr:Protein SDA1-like protein [Dichanthelium oligosanthes]
MPRKHAPAFTPEAASASASSGAAQPHNLPVLQAKMKRDPEGYEEELRQLHRHFESSVFLFRQQAALATTSSSGGGGEVARELGDLALFLAHVAPFYPDDLADLPDQIGGLLDTNARGLPPGLRAHLVQALILMVNRKAEEESRAKRAFTILCDLHRRRVWFDERTTNAICDACFHPSSRIMIAAISFLLGYENAEQEDDSDASSSEDEADQNPQVLLSKQDVYKANHKGTAASKKKKKAKLQRVIRSMKRQQRKSVEEAGSSYYSPLTYLKDAQGFAEKLFSRLQKCNERFEVRMMMLKVIARTIGLHHLVLLNFYPYLQRYVQPHQRDVTTLLAAAVQACHDMVPPDAVEPLFKQIVNQFVHDRSRPEAIAVGLNVVREICMRMLDVYKRQAVGLNVVREICMRMPLMMNEDLLQDLVLYKKSHEKAVSIAARSLITLFREICPSLLVKKDRGRPVDPKARPKAFGEVTVASDVPGAELLDENISSEGEGSDNESDAFDSDDETDLPSAPPGTEENMEGSSDANKLDANEDTKEEDEAFDEDVTDEGQDSSNNTSDEIDEELDDDSDMDADTDMSDEDNNDDKELKESINGSEDEGPDQDEDSDGEDKSTGSGSKVQKRKLSDYIGELNAADASLRALKRLAGVKKAQVSSDESGKILSDEDFKRIKELKAKKEAKLALAQHGLIKGGDTKSATFKMPSSDQLSRKRVDPLQLEALSLSLSRTQTDTHMLDTVKFDNAGTCQKKDVERRKIGLSESWERG